MVTLLALLALTTPRFEDVTASVGIEPLRPVAAEPPMIGGAAWLRLDDDRWPDLLLTGDTGPVVLLKNEGGTSFVDVTSSGGDLANFRGAMAADTLVVAGRPAVVLVATDPDRQDTSRAYVFVRQFSEGPWREVVLPHFGGNAFFPAHGDLDGDGDHDLVLGANSCDHGPAELARLFRFDQQDFGFAIRRAAPWPAPGCSPVPLITDYFDRGEPVVVAVNDFGPLLTPTLVIDGEAVHRDLPAVYGMGAAVGDLNDDGRSDYVFTSIGRDVAWVSDGDGRRDATEQYGVANAWGASAPRYKWGAALFDADNDGDLELWTTAGWQAAGDLYLNDTLQGSSLIDDGVDVASEAGVATPTTDRTIALADFDRDGRVDALVGSLEAWALYRNVSDAGHWIELLINDDPGTVVHVTACGVTRQREWVGGVAGGAPEAMVHVGLGTCAEAARVTVRRPWRAEQVHDSVPVDEVTDLRAPADVIADAAVRFAVRPDPPRIGFPLEVVASQGPNLALVTTIGETPDAPSIEVTWEGETHVVPIDPVLAVDPQASRVETRRTSGGIEIIVAAVDGLGQPVSSQLPLELLRNGLPLTATWEHLDEAFAHTLTAVPTQPLRVRVGGVLLDARIEGVNPGALDPSRSALYVRQAVVRADGSDVVDVLLYPLDSEGRRLDVEGLEVEAEGLTWQTPGQWSETFVDTHRFAWTRFVVDDVPGEAVVRVGGLETRVRKVNGPAPVPVITHSTLEQQGDRLVLFLRDAQGHLVGSGVEVDAGFEYVGRGRYERDVADPLDVRVGGSFAFRVRDGAVSKRSLDDGGTCSVGNAARSPWALAWGLIGLCALRLLRNGARVERRRT